MDSNDLRRGALRALVNSASLAEAAAHLFRVGHNPGCLVLAVSAREELGRCALLATRADKMKPSERVLPANLRTALDDHDSKLRAGQFSVPVQMPAAWLQEWLAVTEANDRQTVTRLARELDVVDRKVRKREPQQTHLRRLRAQYVDPQDDGSWTDPSVIDIGETRAALMDVVCAVAQTLLSLSTSQAFGDAKAAITLPTMGEFTHRVFGIMTG